MGTEIERKFLVKNDSWRKNATGINCRQGYLSSVKERTVRVRIIGEKGYLTIKGVTTGLSRAEYEYIIPKEEANELLCLCEKPIIEKKRYKIEYKDLILEIDEFFGENEGLVIAEIELQNENQKIDVPEWIGEEVSGDSRYFNSNLIKYPYKNW